jgi:ATP:corrinoid adenosyltransferase
MADDNLNESVSRLTQTIAPKKCGAKRNYRTTRLKIWLLKEKGLIIVEMQVMVRAKTTAALGMVFAIVVIAIRSRLYNLLRSYRNKLKKQRCSTLDYNRKLIKCLN